MTPQNISRNTQLQRARSKLIQNLKEKGILNSETVERCMMNIPRHLFVDEALWEMAYQDRSLPIGYGQTISHPSTVALMTENLDISPNHRILEIGTGSGYQTAILAELAKKVFSVEWSETLARKARKRMQDLGYYSVRIEIGDGSQGWPAASPFDRIIVTAGSPTVPEILRNQLEIDGILLIPTGSETSQKMMKITRTSHGFRNEDIGEFEFVKLQGKFGWPTIS